MQKPHNYDNTQAAGEFKPIELGGHILTIKGVKEQKSKSNRDMIVVAFDFAQDDIQKGYFMDQFRKDIRPDKKWPHAGTNYIMVEDASGNCSKSFKTFISCVEKSNNFRVSWGDNFCQQFAGKTVGGVFGEVENEYNGKTSMRHELRWFCGVDAVKDATVPEPKYLNNVGTDRVSKPSGDSFMDTSSSSDEEIPFL